MTDFDFGLRDSELHVGIEVEYPIYDPTQDEFLVSRGRDSNDMRNRMHGAPAGGRVVYDGTVGTEIVSNTMPVADAPEWYASTINGVEAEYEQYQPVGLMSGGNTAGTHIHISPLSEREARELYEISQTTWAKVLFCSSISNDRDTATWPVFRGGRYCQMDFGRDHYNVVNSCGSRHYEWRLPEPMLKDHMEVVARFLSLFKQDVSLAREYAQELLNDADERITSIRRAEKVGMDIEEVPVVERQPAEGTEAFYEEISASWSYPDIYQVSFGDEQYYILQSEFEGEFDVAGVTVETNDVVYADTLESVEAPEVRDDVRRAFTRRNADEYRETPATEELKKIVKKKKGKIDDAGN